jgi:hypothetical protein
MVENTSNMKEPEGPYFLSICLFEKRTNCLVTTLTAEEDGLPS